MLSDKITSFFFFLTRKIKLLLTKIFANNILDKVWKGGKKEKRKHCETCRKLLLAFSPFPTVF